MKFTDNMNGTFSMKGTPFFESISNIKLKNFALKDSAFKATLKIASVQKEQVVFNLNQENLNEAIDYIIETQKQIVEKVTQKLKNDVTPRINEILQKFENSSFFVEKKAGFGDKYYLYTGDSFTTNLLEYDWYYAISLGLFKMDGVEYSLYPAVNFFPNEENTLYRKEHYIGLKDQINSWNEELLAHLNSSEFRNKFMSYMKSYDIVVPMEQVSSLLEIESPVFA